MKVWAVIIKGTILKNTSRGERSEIYPLRESRFPEPEEWMESDSQSVYISLSVPQEVFLLKYLPRLKA